MSALIGLLVIVILVLVIVQMIGGTKTKITYQFEPQQGYEPPPLPERTPDEIKAGFDAMPSEWVTYEGATPPLRLHLRGSTYENLRRVSRNLIDQMGGQKAMDQLPVEQVTQLMFGINSKLIAEAYVLDWEGAQYPNGAAMPFSSSNMAALLDSDSYLLTFVTDHAHRLSPDWKDGQPPPVF